MYPDFIFIGPSKSGSTWIFEVLKSHPGVFVPTAKDIYFFDKYYDRGFQWYEKFFQTAKPYQKKGEICHDYLMSAEAIDRIATHYPAVKLICCLRDPYERAWSSFNYFQRNGLALGKFSEEIKKHPEIVEEGLYFKHISNVFSKFEKHQLLILFFEDLKRNSEDFARQIFNFIDVDIDFKSPLIGRIINKGGQSRSKYIARITKLSAMCFRKMGFPGTVGYFKRNKLLLRLLYKEHSQSNTKRNFLNEFPKELIEIYNNEINNLDELLSADFSHWKR